MKRAHAYDARVIRARVVVGLGGRAARGQRVAFGHAVLFLFEVPRERVEQQTAHSPARKAEEWSAERHRQRGSAVAKEERRANKRVVI